MYTFSIFFFFFVQKVDEFNHEVSFLFEVKKNSRIVTKNMPQAYSSSPVVDDHLLLPLKQIFTWWANSLVWHNNCASITCCGQPIGLKVLLAQVGLSLLGLPSPQQKWAQDAWKTIKHQNWQAKSNSNAQKCYNFFTKMGRIFKFLCSKKIS